MVDELLGQMVSVCELITKAKFYRCYRLDNDNYFEVFYDLDFVAEERIEYIDFRIVGSFEKVRICFNEEIEHLYSDYHVSFHSPDFIMTMRRGMTMRINYLCTLHN